MDQAEIDALAKYILSEALEETINWAKSGGEVLPLFNDVQETADGEIILVYGGSSVEGYGSFHCHYKPLEAVKKIMSECERIYDEYALTAQGQRSGEAEPLILDEESLPIEREGFVAWMSFIATRLLLSYLTVHFFDALVENFRDAALVAEACLAATIAKQGRFEGLKLPADVRPQIEGAAERVALRKKELLKMALNIPAWLVERGPGRPKGTIKPTELKVREREEFAAKVENTIRALLVTTGKIPTKTAVAKQMGVGGINPNTGTDTSLIAFNNKLRRLGIDYDEIKRKVELNG